MKGLLFFLALWLVPGVAGAELTIEEAVASALARNERAKIADRTVDAADARVEKARAFFFPDVTVRGTWTHRSAETTFQSQDSFDAVLAGNLTLFDARGFPLYRAAKLDRDATELEAADTRRALAYEVAAAYLQVLGQGQVLAAAERRLELAKKSQADAKARLEAGIESSHDVTRADLEVATAEREVTRNRGALQTMTLQLGYLIGAEIEEPLVEPADLLAAAASEAQGKPDPEQRLDVRALRTRARAADALADEPMARLIPVLGATGQFSLSNDEGFAGRTSDWFFGVTLTWVLYDGGERYADKKEREAVAAIADLQADAAARGVGVQISGAYVTLESARASVTQATVAVDVARRNHDEARVLYREDLATAFEVSDSAVQLFEAEVTLARERYALALALLDLRSARGLDPFGKEVTP